ncbi:MAG: L,D-transpeptidase family protein [Pseudomonadota bacterium]
MTAESGRMRRVRPFSMVRRWFITAVLMTFSPQAFSADLPVADFVRVDKSDRTLTLYRGDEVLRQFPVALGFEPIGDKEQEGDNKTPEGRYRLDHRNTESNFFLSIRISYPSADDVASARSRGVKPGGQIMIHGQPNEPKYSTGYYASTDWTNGCIAVSNLAMIDIWLMTEVDTPIEIVP